MQGRKKVYVLGGGIGGLSAAHELSKYPDLFEVILLERQSSLGGQASSIYKDDGEHSELCFHAFSSSYLNLLNIMDEVMDDEDYKLISHLKPLDKFIYGNDQTNYIEYKNSFITEDISKFLSGYKKLYKEDISLIEKIKLLGMYIYALSISDERLESYDSVLWKDYVSDMSPRVKRWILDSTAIYLGMDYSKLSTHFMFDLLRKEPVVTKLPNEHTFYSLDGPMYTYLFKPWKKHLEKNGVKFMMETEVVKINHTDELSELDNLETMEDLPQHTGKYISSIDVIQNNKTTTLSGDYFINAMDVKNLATLYPAESKFPELYNNSRQIQCQVLFYLPYKLQPLGTSPTILISPDSPWFLMTRIESDLWELEDNDLLSCGIGIWDVEGYNGKKAINCTREELASECWAQIIKSQHNLKLSSELPEWDIWSSYVFNEKTGEMDTFEPKFSNNINTLVYRPSFVDSVFSNMFHATSYTRNMVNIYNMESGATSGVESAHLLIEKHTDIKFHSKTPKPNVFLRVIRFIDSLIFKLGSSIKKIFQKN
jgi:hypothetical protein